MNLSDLHTFSLVAETGTISGAAQRLGVPKSTVSRRVRRLEDALGHELLRRSHRAVSLTEHGAALHRRAAPSLQELQSAVDALAEAESEPSGALRITTTPAFGRTGRFVRCIRDFGFRYPNTTIELDLTNRVVQVVEEGFDVGVRLHGGELPGGPNLMARRILGLERALYASPAYIDEMGAPRTPADLADHRIAAHAVADAQGIRWSRGDERLPDELIPLPAPRWMVNDSSALEQLALAGAGLAMLMTSEAEPHVEQGALVRVLPHLAQRSGNVSLVWPASRHLAPRVRAFIDHAVTSLGDD